MHVIDLISPSLPGAAEHDRRPDDGPRHFDAPHRRTRRSSTSQPGFFTRFLSTLIDPNIVSLLFLAGLAGLGFELFHPGVVIPGAFGAICMVCALFGFSVLPLSWAGLILVLLGAALLVIDAHVTTHGALDALGARRDGGRARDALPQGARAVPRRTTVIVVVTALLGGAWAFAMAKAVAVQRRARHGSGRETDRRDGGRRARRRLGLRPRRALARAVGRPARAGERSQRRRLDGLTLDVLGSSA